LLRLVVWRFTNVSEVLAASTIRAVKMEAVSTSEMLARPTSLYAVAKETFPEIEPTVLQTVGRHFTEL
jgi:hypothetical protein